MLSLDERLKEIDRVLAGEQRALGFLAPATATSLAAAKCPGSSIDVRFIGNAFLR